REDVVAQRLVVGVALAGPRRLQDVHVEALVAEEALVARDQQRQVVDRVHHRHVHLLQSLGVHSLALSRVGGGEDYSSASVSGENRSSTGIGFGITCCSTAKRTMVSSAGRFALTPNGNGSPPTTRPRSSAFWSAGDRSRPSRRRAR